MKKITLLLLTFTLFIFTGKSQSVKTGSASKPIHVQYSKNVELLGFVYFVGYEGRQLENETDSLIRNREINQYAYGYHLYQQYKKYENSENLAVIIGFAQNIWLDYFINLLLQLDDFPHARLTDAVAEKYYIRFSDNKDPIEAKKNAAACLDAFNKLYKEVNFGNYLVQNRRKYENALEQVKSRLPSATFIPAMEKFYKQQFEKYTLVPSLTIPAGMGFGARYSHQNKTNIFNVFGAWGQQQFMDDTLLDMGFGDEKQIRELSIHEFGHSFVNPVVDQIPEELLTRTENLYKPIKEDMTRQNYTQWKHSVYEHFVRAGEILIARSLGYTKEAKMLQKHYIEDRKFIYLPVILKELEAYTTTSSITYTEAAKKAMQRLSKLAPHNPDSVRVKER
jgi:hypothetical protein